MITFLLLGAGAIVVIALTVAAFSANQQKRSRQSGASEAKKQQDVSTPRATGKN